MPFAFTCPSCRSTSRVLDQLAGTRARCPTCGNVVPIPAFGIPVTVAPSVPPLIDEPPLAPRSDGNSGAVMALLVGALCVFVCCGGGGLIGLFALVRDKTHSETTDAKGQATHRAGVNRPESVDEKELYQSLLRSTAWVLASDGRRAALGSAAVVHRDQRLLVTNAHLVRSHLRVTVVFPEYKGGQTITQPNHYFDMAAKDGLKAKVVYTDPARDIALLQVDTLPNGINALPLAAEAPTSGQWVRSVGAAERLVGFGDEEDALWRFETMQVKRVALYDHKYKDGQRVNARVIEMGSAADNNGFGGAVVDERGQVVGVLCDFARDNVRLAIELRELRAVLEAHFSSLGLRWPEGAPPPAAPTSPAQDVTNDSPAYWLQIVRDDLARAEKARERIVVMGRAAILELRKALRDKDPRMRVAAASVLGEMGDTATGAIADLIKALSDGERSVRAAAARALGQLGKLAHAALGALVIASTDSAESVRTAAEAAVPKVGSPTPDDVPKLVTLWNEKDPTKRERFLTILLSAKMDGAIVGLLVVPLLADSETKIRLRAIRAIEAAGSPAHAAAFGKLLAAAGGNDAEVRKAAMAALAKLGPPLAADRRDLEAALRATQKDLRLYGVNQLGELGPAAGESAPDIARLLRDVDPTVRVAAAQALGKIGKPAALVLPDLMVAAHDVDPNVRAAALTALARISREGRIVAMLIDALADDVSDVRQTAAKALRALDPPLSRENVPALRGALKSRNVEARRCAASELARMGNEAAAAAKEVFVAASDPDYEVRRYAFAALPLLGEKAKEALPIVLETMSAILAESGRKPGSLELFRQASQTLVKLGDPLDALPIWSKGLKTSDKALRKEVVQSLATIGPPARKAAVDLAALLDDAELATAASDTLMAMRGEEVVQALIHVLEENPSIPAKIAASQLLGKMGPEAKNAYQALYQTSQRYKDNKDLFKASSDALKQIVKK